ncbi:MAG: hypothetical protein ACKO2Z_16565, partial [Sphaerospermopsis kisseleviana]
PVRAKHSENSLFIKLIIFRPNASPLRLLTPDIRSTYPITYDIAISSLLYCLFPITNHQSPITNVLS